MKDKHGYFGLEPLQFSEDLEEAADRGIGVLLQVLPVLAAFKLVDEHGEVVGGDYGGVDSVLLKDATRDGIGAQDGEQSGLLSG